MKRDDEDLKIGFESLKKWRSIRKGSTTETRSNRNNETFKKVKITNDQLGKIELPIGLILDRMRTKIFSVMIQTTEMEVSKRNVIE